MGMHAQRRMAARSNFQPRPTSVISEQPKGQLIEGLNRTSNGFLMDQDYAWEAVLTGALSTIVVANNGDVYLYNPISQLETYSWLKLEKAEGDTLVCHLPQDVYTDYYYYNDAATYFGIDHDTTVVYQLQRLVYGEDANGSWYFPDNSGKTDMKFIFNGDTLRSIDEKDVLLGMADKNGEWQGYGDISTCIKRIKEAPAQAPDAAKWETYMLDWLTDGETDCRTIQVAINGKDIYLDRLYDGEPEGVVRGTLGDDGIVSIPTHQYLGIDQSNYSHVFFFAGNTYRLNDQWGESLDMFGLGDGSDIQLRFNAETREFTAVKDSVNFLINRGDDMMMRYGCYTHPHFVLYADEALVPAMPVINLDNYAFWDDDWGCGHIEFVLPKRDVEGRFIDSDKLFYNIYIDQKVLTLEPSEYEYLAEDMKDIPYSFTDDYDILSYDGGQRVFCFYRQEFTAIGVQSVYKGGGVENRSPIAWLNFDDVAVKGAQLSTTESPRIYDLQGRRVTTPAKGVYLRNGKKQLF